MDKAATALPDINGADVANAAPFCVEELVGPPPEPLVVVEPGIGGVIDPPSAFLQIRRLSLSNETQGSEYVLRENFDKLDLKPRIVVIRRCSNEVQAIPRTSG